MQENFNSVKFISSLGNELVSEFAKAGMGIHPCAVGSGREKSVKNKLAAILPAGVGVGSGFVIDSFGNTSKQCDIIIYEKNYALRFIINDDEDFAYYNCESVIAVGEVKSDASAADIKDSFQKFQSVRMLQRKSSDLNIWRKYLHGFTTQGTPQQAYSQQENTYDQIFTFLVCKSFKTTFETICEKASEICKCKSEYFNTLLSTEGDLITYQNDENSVYSALDGNAIIQIESDFSFNLLVNMLIFFIRAGRTTPFDVTNYIVPIISLPVVKFNNYKA